LQETCGRQSMTFGRTNTESGKTLYNNLITIQPCQKFRAVSCIINKETKGIILWQQEH